MAVMVPASEGLHSLPVLRIIKALVLAQVRALLQGPLELQPVLQVPSSELDLDLVPSSKLVQVLLLVQPVQLGHQVLVLAPVLASADLAPILAEC